MKKMFVTLGLIAAAAVPASAMQQPQGNAQTTTPRPPTTVQGELTLYQMNNYNGETWVIDSASNRVRTDWPIRSLSIHPGDRWQICALPRFRECIVLDRSVHDASLIGVTNQIGSARPAPAEEPQGN